MIYSRCQNIFKTIALLTVFCIFAMPVLAHAQTLDTVASTFEGKFKAMNGSLLSAAKVTFWWLAAIELAYALISNLAFKKADIGDILQVLTQSMFFIGFGAFILYNGAGFMADIIKSFVEAGTNAGASVGGSAATRPGDTLQAGLVIANNILNMPTDTDLQGQDVGMFAQVGFFILKGIIAVVLIIVFALLAAMQIITTIAAWAIATIALLFLGFFGSRWTKDIAHKAIIGVLAVGAKLMVMNIIIAVGYSLFTDMKTMTFTNWNDAFTALGVAIALLALVKVIPDMTQSVISGASFNGSHSIATTMGAMAAIGGAVAQAVKTAGGAAIGGGQALNGAGKLASEQLKTSEGQGTAPKSGLGKAGEFAKNMVTNLAGAGMSDINSRLNGTNLGNGNMGSRMGKALSDTAEGLKANRTDNTNNPASKPQNDTNNKPSNPSGGNNSPDGGNKPTPPTNSIS